MFDLMIFNEMLIDRKENACIFEHIIVILRASLAFVINLNVYILFVNIHPSTWNFL